jgi:hypothetical protein
MGAEGDTIKEAQQVAVCKCRWSPFVKTEEWLPGARFELATLRLTAVNLISSQVAGAELNRGKSASSDQIGLVRFSFSFLFLLAFCSFSRHSYDTYMTPAVSQVRLDRLTSE